MIDAMRNHLSNDRFLSFNTQKTHNQRIKVSDNDPWQQPTPRNPVSSAEAIMNHIAYGKASAQAPPVQLGFFKDFFPPNFFFAQLKR